MKYTRARLRDAILFAIAVGATSIGAAFAQAQTGREGAADAAQQDASTLDSVVVTGSRIRQVDVETAQPVHVITRQDIETQGFQSVGDIIQNITAAGNPPLSRTSPSSSGMNAGGTYISLRDLGAERTLVLVNGRRMGVGLNGRADLSLIPAVAVQSVEVLKDGASSIYGSDAIAGVINIITRSDFEGTTVSGYYGQYGEGDGAITRGDAIFGYRGDRGSLTIAAEQTREDRVRAADRSYSRYPVSASHPTDGWNTNTDSGVFLSTPSDALPNVVYNGTTRVLLRPGGDPMNPADYIAQDLDVGGCLPNSAGSPGPGTCRPGSTAGKFNPNEDADLRIPRETKSVYLDGMFDVTADVRLRANLLYSDRSSTRTTSGRPLTASRFDIPISADSYFNPVGRDIPDWFRRSQEVLRQTTNDLTTYRISAAIEGTFEAGDRPFDWDVSYLHNRNKLLLTGLGDMGVERLRSALGPSFLDPATGNVVCGVPGARIADCVPYNPFLPAGVAGAGSLEGNQALHDYLFHVEHDRGETTTEAFSANLTGSLWTLPAGDLGFAVGGEYRRESGEFIPDQYASEGLSTNQADSPTAGSYSVREVYAEIQAPLLADLPFARELTLSLASRYSDYDTFGDTTNSKIGLKWKPIDSLMLRATVADGFRAPTIIDLYGGLSETAGRYTDPCDVVFGSSANNPTTRANCRAALGAGADSFRQLSQAGTPVTGTNSGAAVPFFSGSNEALQPETSRSWVVGAVWSPSFLSGFNAALDWWKVRIEDTIVSDSPQMMLDDCYVFGIDGRCGVTSGNGFTRDPVTGNVDSLQYGRTNAGYREAEGYDLDLAYQFGSERFGRVRIASNSTYNVRDVSTSTNLPQHPVSGIGWGSSFRLRSNLRLDWERGAYGASWTTRYHSSMTEQCRYFTSSPSGVPPVTEPHLECDWIGFAPTGVLNPDGSPQSELSRRRSVGSTTFHDIQFRVKTPWDATVSLGANNVFEKVGPVMYTQPASGYSYYGGYDVGRFVYMRYTQRF